MKSPAFNRGRLDALEGNGFSPASEWAEDMDKLAAYHEGYTAGCAEADPGKPEHQFKGR